MLFPLAYTLAKRYHIENVALVGLLFLPVGVGNVIGAPLAGRFSDWIVVSYRAKRKGVWVPEDRLRATFIGAGILAPMSVLLSGLITTYVPGTLGIVLNMLVFFLNGVGVDMALSPSAAYFVDVLHTRSAEVISATKCVSSPSRPVLYHSLTHFTVPCDRSSSPLGVQQYCLLLRHSVMLRRTLLRPSLRGLDLCMSLLPLLNLIANTWPLFQHDLRKCKIRRSHAGVDDCRMEYAEEQLNMQESALCLLTYSIYIRPIT
jgi:hypothetical protein